MGSDMPATTGRHLVSSASFPRRHMSTTFYTLTERTMLTADGKAVPAGHPDGVTLLGSAGHRIPYAAALRYGLVKPEKKPTRKSKGSES